MHIESAGGGGKGKQTPISRRRRGHPRAGRLRHTGGALAPALARARKEHDQKLKQDAAEAQAQQLRLIEIGKAKEAAEAAAAAAAAAPEPMSWSPTRRRPSWAASPPSPACPSAAAAAADAEPEAAAEAKEAARAAAAAAAARCRRRGRRPRRRRRLRRRRLQLRRPRRRRLPSCSRPFACRRQRRTRALTPSQKPEPSSRRPAAVSTSGRRNGTGLERSAAEDPGGSEGGRAQNIMRVMERDPVWAQRSGGGARGGAGARGGGASEGTITGLARLLQPGAARRRACNSCKCLNRDGLLLDLSAQTARWCNARPVPARQGRPRADQARHRGDDERRLPRLGQGGGQR